MRTRILRKSYQSHKGIPGLEYWYGAILDNEDRIHYETVRMSEAGIRQALTTYIWATPSMRLKLIPEGEEAINAIESK